MKNEFVFALKSFGVAMLIYVVGLLAALCHDWWVKPTGGSWGAFPLWLIYYGPFVFYVAGMVVAVKYLTGGNDSDSF